MIRTTSTIAAAAALALTGGLVATGPQAGALPGRATANPVGTVTSQTLVGRQAPTTRAPRVAVNDQRELLKGQKVLIGCKVHGETVAGNDLWYRIVSPRTTAWISARYVRNNAVLPQWCGGNDQRVTAVKRLVVRQAPTTLSPVVRSVAKGARLTAVCSVPDNRRNALDWYYTTDGNWVWGNGLHANGPIAPCA